MCDIIHPSRLGPLASATVQARGNGALYARVLAGILTCSGQVLCRAAGAMPLAHRAGRSWLDD